MATETTYNVIKVQELRAISSAAGNDEIIINDVNGTPLETKKITVENFAYAIKDYVLPIASAEILGGIRVGEGLTINPATGVLRNDIYYINDLHDVQVVNPQPNQVITYNGVAWVNSEFQGVTEIIAGDGLSGGGDNGSVIINVNPGDGISIENDRVNVNTGLGLKTELDVLLVDNHHSLTFVGNQLAVNAGTAIIIDEFGVSVNYGRGFTMFGPTLEPNLGRGLGFEGDTIAVRAGAGLGFEQADLVVNAGFGLRINNDEVELYANIQDLLNVQYSQELKEDQVLIYQNGFWTNGTPIKFATLEDHGTVEVATVDELTEAWYGGDVFSDSGAVLVLDVNDLDHIRKLILDDFNLLKDGEAIVYVHKDVNRLNATSDATGDIPTRVQELYDVNKAIHEKDNIPVNHVAFRSLRQAMTFIDGRDPVSLAQVTIYIIGPSDHDPGQQNIWHSGKKKLEILGDLQNTSTARDNNVIYMGQCGLVQQQGAGELSLKHITLNVNGNISNPYERGKRLWAISHSSGLVLQNTNLICLTNVPWVQVLTYDYERIDPKTAYVTFNYKDDFPTQIMLWGDCNANWSYYPHGTFADYVVGDFTIKGWQGANYARNKLIFRFAHSAPSTNYLNHHSYVRGKMIIEFKGYKPGTFPNYGNSFCDIELDYPTKATSLKQFGELQNGILFWTSATSSSTNTQASLTVNVKNRGNIGVATILQARGQGADLQSLWDRDNQYYPSVGSVTGLFVGAWQRVGTAVTALRFPGTNTWNGSLMAMRDVQIAGDYSTDESNFTALDTTFDVDENFEDSITGQIADDLAQERYESKVNS